MSNPGGVLSESLRDTKRWLMWAGTDTDFRQVLRTVTMQYEPHLPSYIDHETAHLKNMLGMSNASLSRNRTRVEESTTDQISRALWTSRVEEDERQVAEYEERLAAAVASAERGADIKLTLNASKTERRETRGTPDELIEYLQHRKFKTLRFEAPAGSIGVGTIFINIDDDGVDLYVSSDDHHWASAAYRDLVQQIGHRAPAWRWIRSLWFMVPLLILAAFSSAYWILDAIGDAFGPPINTVVTVLYIPASVGLFFLSFILLRRWLKPFQILQPGQRPGLVALAAVLGTSVVGAVAGAILQAILGK